MNAGDLVMIKHIEANPETDRGLIGLIVKKQFLDYPYDDEYFFYIQTRGEIMRYHQNRLELLNEKR